MILLSLIERDLPTT